jgi:hypothetical protein
MQLQTDRIRHSGVQAQRVFTCAKPKPEPPAIGGHNELRIE